MRISRLRFCHRTGYGRFSRRSAKRRLSIIGWCARQIFAASFNCAAFNDGLIHPRFFFWKGSKSSHKIMWTSCSKSDPLFADTGTLKPNACSMARTQRRVNFLSARARASETDMSLSTVADGQMRRCAAAPSSLLGRASLLLSDITNGALVPAVASSTSASMPVDGTGVAPLARLERTRFWCA